MSDSRVAAELPALRLKRNEDRRLHAGHLWIFSNEVDTEPDAAAQIQAGRTGARAGAQRPGAWASPTSIRSR